MEHDGFTSDRQTNTLLGLGLGLGRTGKQTLDRLREQAAVSPPCTTVVYAQAR